MKPFIDPTQFRGELRFGESMARHVSWRAGGKAAHVYIPADLADLSVFLSETRIDEPVLFVGLGSNLLVRDGGYNGTVVLTHGALDTLRLEKDTGLIYAEAGVASAKLARFAATHGHTGTEFLATIPGTVGGALAMNAGCYGSETWSIVDHVCMIDRHGGLIERHAEDFEIGYRHVSLRSAAEEWFAAAWFRLPTGDGEASRERMRVLLEQRSASQPLQLPNAGSVFRNPPGDHAARLIEAAGLKGTRIGGAEISTKHANFIVNPKGQATAGDIEALIERAQQVVLEKFGVELMREVRIVGDRTGSMV